MSREEYLNQLHKYLRKLPRQDYEDAMEYFTEYFQEIDEEEAAELMKELGTPKEAARELMRQTDRPERSRRAPASMWYGSHYWCCLQHRWELHFW